MFTLIVSNIHFYSYLIVALGFCPGPPEMTITSVWQRGNRTFVLLARYNRNPAKNYSRSIRFREGHFLYSKMIMTVSLY